MSRTRKGPAFLMTKQGRPGRAGNGSAMPGSLICETADLAGAPKDRQKGHPMSNAAKHSVILFALNRGQMVWDANDAAVVERIVKCDDLDHAKRLTRDAIIATGTMSAASLSPEVSLFDDLIDYLRAINFSAQLAEEFPQMGHCVAALTEDLSHWAQIGVRTPAHLAAYLDGCFEREMEKASWG